MSFDYGPVPFREGYRPIIPIVFVNNNDSNDFIAEGILVDSGADFTIISLTLAKRINLVLDNKKKLTTSGIGGTAEVIRSKGEIILLRGAEAYKIPIPIDVVIDNTKLPYPLLGRIPIFNLFDITFRQRKLKINFDNKIGLERITIPNKLYKTQKGNI